MIIKDSYQAQLAWNSILPQFRIICVYY